jgi:hypothetical protein
LSFGIVVMLAVGAFAPGVLRWITLSSAAVSALLLAGAAFIQRQAV